MNLYVILLFFVIQGPGPACGGHKDGVFSSEEPWTKEDLSGASGEDEEQLDPNSGANTDEDDNLNFDGYDSGSHSDDREHDDENPKTYPRASRSYSNTRTITSGLGEDEGGGHEGGSHSKSQWNSDDESSNGDKDSKMDLTKIGDAIDVMKKLKKAKSDEEFAKKLNSGPESLGVAFKTFEQLSGLWISVMHRIWRVWKAKGAKEVMHSIVHSMLNNTRRAITRKVGNLLSNKTAILDLNDNGSGANLGTALPTLNEGSSQPEHIPHLAATQKNPVSGIATRVHNISETIPSKTLNSAKVKLQTTKPVQHFSPKDLPVKQIDVSFIKNLSKSTKTQSAESNHTQKSSSKQTVILPVEDVKVSFSSKKAAIAHTLRPSKIVNQSQHEEVRETDDTSGVTDFSVDKGKKKEITKTIDLNDTTVGVVHSPSSTNATSKSSSEEVSQPSQDINSGREPKDDRSEGTKAVPVDGGNQVERDISQSDAKQGNHDDRENKTDTEKIIVNETAETYTRKNNMEIKDGTTLGKGTSTVEQSVTLSKNSSQGSVGQGGQEPKQLKDSDKRLGLNVHPPENLNDSQSNRNIPQDQHQNFKGTAEQTDTAGKTREEETLKINFQKTDRKADLRKGNISKSQLNKTSRDDVSAMDSLKSGENKKEELEEKAVVDFQGKSDSANSYQQDQNNNQSAHASDTGKIKLNESQANKPVVTAPSTSAPPQSENIGIHFHKNLEQLRDKTKDSLQRETASSDSLKGGTKDEKPKGNMEDNSASSDQHDEKNNKPSNANTDKLQGKESQAPTSKDKKIEISQNETENSAGGENHIPRESSYKTSGTKTSENINGISSKDKGNLTKQEKQTNAGNASVAQSHESETLSNAPSVHHDHNDLQSVNNDKKHELNSVSKLHDPPERNIVVSTPQTRNTTKNNEGQYQGEAQNTQNDILSHTRDPEKNDRRTPNALTGDVNHVQHHNAKRTKSSRDISLKNSTKAVGNADTLGSAKTTTTGRFQGNMDHSVKHQQQRIKEVNVKSKKLETSFEKESSHSQTIAQPVENDVQTDSFAKTVQQSTRKETVDVKKGHEQTENKASKQFSNTVLKEEIHSNNKSSSTRSEKDAASSASTQNAITISEPVSDDNSNAPSTTVVTGQRDAGVGLKKVQSINLDIPQNNTKNAAEHMPSQPEEVIKTKENDLSKAPATGLRKQSADSSKPLPVSPGGPSKSAGLSTQQTNKTNGDTVKVERPPAEETGASLSSEDHRINDGKTVLNHAKKSTKQKSQHRDEKAKEEDERSDDRKSKRLKTHMSKMQQTTKLRSDTQVSGTANRAKSKDAVRPLSVDKAQTRESESKEENNKTTLRDSSRTELKPTNPRREEIKPSQTKQVDVMTSRTPPTSLLTTSSDDNTYSIKQIIQGPNGTSYVYPNPDKPNVRVLERKVAKLESEVTVLETAMADLAKRLLVIEQRPGNSKPTMPPSIQAEKEDTSRESPVHHQQTTVYVGKDLVSPPKGPVPEPGPQRIVIPISSLYPEGEAHGTQLVAHGAKIVSPPSASVLQMQDNNNDAAKADVEKLEKTQDMNHVAVPVGSQSPPASESHAIVRPIVNIIMPNNREDLLSEGALCIPRCQNGGRCLEGNTCKCATFFTGVHCERFSLRDLLNSPKTWASPYRKLQRLVVTEPPDRQDQVERTFNLDSEPQTLRLKDLNQVYEPEKDIVAKQQPVEIMPPNTGKAEVDDGVRRKQLILEI